MKCRKPQRMHLRYYVGERNANFFINRNYNNTEIYTRKEVFVFLIKLGTETGTSHRNPSDLCC